MFNNLRGVKSKIDSINQIVEEESPAILALAETKLRDGEKLKIDGYETESGRVDRVIIIINCFLEY